MEKIIEKVINSDASFENIQSNLNKLLDSLQPDAKI